MAKKARTKKTKELMRRVASLGCMICGRPAELHHITGAGMGLKAKDEDVIPICAFHHRLGNYGEAIHAGVKGWEAIYGTQEGLLRKVKQLMEQEQ